MAPLEETNGTDAQQMLPIGGIEAPKETRYLADGLNNDGTCGRSRLARPQIKAQHRIWGQSHEEANAEMLPIRAQAKLKVSNPTKIQNS